MRIFPLLLISLMISACSPRLVSLPEPTQVEQAVDAPIPSPTPALDSQLDEMVARAVEDLSMRLSLDPRLVRVILAEDTLWPDAALGCPRPGEVYAQQEVPGYRIILEGNGQIYIYHTDADKAVILCTEEDRPSFPVTPGDIDDGAPWMPVD